MFIVRLISGIILIILSIILVGSGGRILLLTSLIISLIGLFELYKALNIQKRMIAYIGYMSSIAYYILLYLDLEAYHIFLFILTLLALMFTYVLTFPESKTEEISMAFFSIFYVSVLFSYIYRIRMMGAGNYLIWLVFLSSWGSDTCAYAMGMLFGKHKIAPKLSPKKSLEGAIAGVIGSALLGVIFALIVRDRMDEVLNPVLACASACAIGSVIAQIGDFAASAIKRNHDIKDFGNLIPGHGGILDRFDSILFTAPAVFYALQFIIK